MYSFYPVLVGIIYYVNDPLNPQQALNSSRHASFLIFMHNADHTLTIIIIMIMIIIMRKLMRVFEPKLLELEFQPVKLTAYTVLRSKSLDNTVLWIAIIPSFLLLPVKHAFFIQMSGNTQFVFALSPFFFFFSIIVTMLKMLFT